jgi:hypothetical protein
MQVQHLYKLLLTKISQSLSSLDGLHYQSLSQRRESIVLVKLYRAFILKPSVELYPLLWILA